LKVRRHLICSVPLSYDPLHLAESSHWVRIPFVRIGWRKSWGRRFWCPCPIRIWLWLLLLGRRSSSGWWIVVSRRAR